MAKRLKVYGGLVMRGHRQARAVIAAHNAQEVADALPGRASAYYVRGYWSVTGNAKEIEAAMATPGVLLLEDEPSSYKFAPPPQC